MSSPKGIRRGEFKIGSTDAVHIYSEIGRIQLQLRRDVPTEASITKPSFKVALTLTPEQAIAVATELLTAATRKASPSNGISKPTPIPRAASPKPVAK